MANVDHHPSIKGFTLLPSLSNNINTTDSRKLWCSVDVCKTLKLEGVNIEGLSHVIKQQNIECVLICNWRDQGWGNQKGTLYVRERGGIGSINLELATWERLVSPAPHARQQLRVQIPPKFVKTEGFELGYSVGGGGGHELYVGSARVRFISKDEADEFLP